MADLHGSTDASFALCCVLIMVLVSGAHNTIITARAGKDLVSSLVSGLLTIGPRFGGAIDDAARYFKDAYDKGLTPYEFVESMKKKGIRVPGIGHRIKRGDNREKRVQLVQQYAVKYMEYAVQVETYTLSRQTTWSLMFMVQLGLSSWISLLAVECSANKKLMRLLKLDI